MPQAVRAVLATAMWDFASDVDQGIRSRVRLLIHQVTERDMTEEEALELIRTGILMEVAQAYTAATKRMADRQVRSARARGRATVKAMQADEEGVEDQS
jgi:hypothetical protein